MSHRIIKNLTMLTLVVGLALAAAVVSANGQSTSTLVTADIPFDFIVANQTLPSGKYAVHTATSSGDSVKISSRDGKSSAIRLADLVAAKGTKRTARMVFHRYGQKYFLAEVWSGDDYGRKLRQCKTEKILRHELASNASKSDSVNGTYEIIEVVALVR
jgi:hypothetical protein